MEATEPERWISHGTIDFSLKHLRPIRTGTEGERIV